MLALYSSDINPVILIAASRGMLNGELLEFLFEYDIDLNYKNANNETALTLAIKYKKYSTIITLIECGADYSYIDDNKMVQIFNSIKIARKHIYVC